MHAYVDETGNTGAKLLDAEQPVFITAALLTRSDFDRRFGDEVRGIARSLGADEIHANRLGVGRIEDAAPELLRVVRKAGPAFALSRVEKSYVLATKVFDTLFDSGENKAVPWHIYNIAPLRIMMAFKVAYLLDHEIVAGFWDALMDTKADRARQKMAEFCVNLRQRVDYLPDQRSREIVGEALDWAVANPETLEFVHASKNGRKGHLPNMIGFGNLLGGIEQQSATWHRPVEVIKHDRQDEFGSAIKFWHDMYSNARDEAVQLPLGQKLVLRKVFGSKLEMSTALDSPGIQIVDVILWLFARSLRVAIPSNCQALLNYVYTRAHQDDFSFAGTAERTEQLIEAINARPLPPGATQDALAFQEQAEQIRLDKMDAYSRSKQQHELGVPETV